MTWNTSGILELTIKTLHAAYREAFEYICETEELYVLCGPSKEVRLATMKRVEHKTEDCQKHLCTCLDPEAIDGHVCCTAAHYVYGTGVHVSL